MESSMPFEDGVETGGNSTLSFKILCRPLEINIIDREFMLMSRACGKPFTAAIAVRICQKSGTHLLKLVSPRADGNHAVLRIESADENRKLPLLPSVNAPDIPFAKIIFRPLEILGYPAKSVVNHVLSPDNISAAVLDAFASVFGTDVLDAIRSNLLGPQLELLNLSAGEFPIIFIPSPKGGDLQITPVSPAIAYMEMKDVRGIYLHKQEKDGPRVPRGRWHKQAVSAKPQNISGAIGGPRIRFLAAMPAGHSQLESELYRYVRGGRFPRWRHPSVGNYVLRYADLLDRDPPFNDQNTYEALNALAVSLIRDAYAFIDETHEEAQQIAEVQGICLETLKIPPSSAELLLRCVPSSELDRARRGLSSAHFGHYERQNRIRG